MLLPLKELLNEPVAHVVERERSALERLMVERGNRVVLFGAGNLGHPDKHTADGTEADNDYGIAGASRGIFETLQDAGQRFRQGRIAITDVSRNFVGILLDNARGNPDEFGISPVVK